MRGKKIFLVWIWILFVGAGWIAAPPAWAHKVYLFAWVEGDRLMVDAYFSKTRKVKNGKIEVLDSSGKVLATATTDEDGACSLPIPAKTDLTLTVDGGMGHKGEFLVKADELPDTAGSQAAAPAGTQEASKTPDAEPQAPAVTGTPTSGPAASIDPGQLKKIVEEALDSRLHPLIRSIADLREDQGPGPIEIIGGIGWIFGIMGLVMFWRSRKKTP